MSIATIYRGIEFRSRLEARWAAFFTEINWNYTYEPFDGDGYIPDFQIHGECPLLVEVKPAATALDYSKPVEKMERGIKVHWDYDTIIVGSNPIAHELAGGSVFGGSCAGWMGENQGPDFGRFYAAGEWMRCRKCNEIGVFHTEQTYTSRPCGHGAGDQYIGLISAHNIEAAWASATNDVKWRGRDAA